MLKSSKRLTTELFKEVVMKGLPFFGSFFVVRCMKGVNGSIPSRFGVSVPKKVAKSAVDRNKIRRRVYSAIESMEDRIKSGLHVVFVMKVGVEKLSFSELSGEIEKIFVKSSILR